MASALPGAPGFHFLGPPRFVSKPDASSPFKVYSPSVLQGLKSVESLGKILQWLEQAIGTSRECPGSSKGGASSKKARKRGRLSSANVDAGVRI